MRVSISSLGGQLSAENLSTKLWSRVDSGGTETYLYGSWSVAPGEATTATLEAASPLPTESWDAFILSYQANTSDIHRVRCDIHEDGAPGAFEAATS